MRRLLFILGVIAAAPAAAATEIPATLDGISLHLPIPDGYCAIDRAQPAEAQLFERQADALQPLNQLLGIAIDCTELAAYRAQNRQFTRYLEFMATQHDGQPIRRPDAASRAAYLAELAGQLPPLDTKALAETAGKPTEHADVATSVQRFGVIAQDEAAVYLAGIATYDSAPLANVSALSAAGGWAVSTNFYRNYVDESTVAGLLDEAKREARTLIAANQPAEAPPPAGAPDDATAGDDSSWIITIAAALALLVAVGTTALLRRRR